LVPFIATIAPVNSFAGTALDVQRVAFNDTLQAQSDFAAVEQWASWVEDPAAPGNLKAGFSPDGNHDNQNACTRGVALGVLNAGLLV
jgi:hypothetical protein